MSELIRVLIADDHAVVREGLRTFLSLREDIEIVGEAEDGEQAVALAVRLEPDVVLMDLVMPKLDGIGATRRARAAGAIVVTATRGLHAIDGLITGWHEPQASHLQILRAATGSELLTRCYQSALANNYLWHEFGDSHLILP